MCRCAEGGLVTIIVDPATRGEGTVAHRKKKQPGELHGDGKDLEWDAEGEQFHHAASAPYSPSEAPTSSAADHPLQGPRMAIPEDVRVLGKICSAAYLAKIQRGEVTLAELSRMPGISSAPELTPIDESTKIKEEDIGSECEEELREAGAI